MGLKKFILKCAKFIVASQPENFTTINVSQIKYNEILLGKNIIITGGSKGIGYAIAKKFVSEGANVIIVGRDEDSLKKSANEIGKKCQYIKFDINDIDKYKIFFQECKKTFANISGNKNIDTLVNNAGISLHEGTFKDVTIETFDKQFDTNFKSTYFLTKEFLEQKLNEKDLFGGG